MNNFTIRVELLNRASAADYEMLHALMQAYYYFRKILGADGVWYNLPPAEYWCASQTGTRDSIRDQALQIARGVDATCRVRVTEGLSSWAGLAQSTYQGGPEWLNPASNVLLSGLLGSTR